MNYASHDPSLSPLENLADWLLTAGIDDPGGVGRDKIVDRVMYADGLARSYVDRFADTPDPNWPSDQPPVAYRDLFAAIVRREYPAVLDHALAWAAFQVELHQAGPGDQWQLLSQSASGVWQANPTGPRALALGGYQIEVAMRGIVIHLEREGYDLVTLDMGAVFQAIDTHVSALEQRPFPLANALARVGLRGVDLNAYIY